MTQLRFTLRELFWLMLVAAIGMGWWTDRQRTADRDELQSMLERITQHVRFHAERNQLSVTELKLTCSRLAVLGSISKANV